LSESNCKICLVVIFNYRFDQNLDKLEKLYSSRFSNRYYLMPFYDGDIPNVIPVYENCSYFQGYFAQGLPHFYNDNFTHYVFIADDLILNPLVNEKNIVTKLHIDNNSAYLPRRQPLNTISNYWMHTISSINALKNAQAKHYPFEGLLDELPTFDEAATLLERHGIDFQNHKISFSNLWTHLSGNLDLLHKLWVFIKYSVENRFNYRSVRLPYPLLRGYSDFVVVPAESIMKFSKFCGVFSSMQLFVETAIPTALYLSCKSIKMQHQHFMGLEFWDKNELSKVAQECNYNVNILFEKFNSFLHIHPVKLTKWEV